MARPYFRCAGGKGALAGRIVDLFPDDFRVYWEPFLGGGAVFFEAARRDLFRQKFVVLSDADTAVTDLWRAVRDRPQEVWEKAEEWAEVIRWQETDEDRRGAYDCLRECWSTGADTHPGTQLILRTLCFNGLWRTNSKGEFNVPPDPKRLENPPLIGLDALEEVSAALFAPTATRILGSSVFACACEPGPDWVIYCDPPYSKTWRKYGTEVAFSPADQVELIRSCGRWAQAGAKVVYSNNYDEDLLREIEASWPGAVVEELQAAQNISAKTSGRKPRHELLVRS